MPFQYRNQTIFGNLQAYFKMYVQEEKARIAKTVLNKKYKVIGLTLPDIKTYRSFLIRKYGFNTRIVNRFQNN